MKKKWVWMVSPYRPWQDPIGQGHGEWNGNRERLYGMAMGCLGRAKIAKNKSKTSNYEDFGSRLVQIDFRLGRSPWNFILERSGRTNIPKYSIFDWFWRNPFFWKNCYFSYIRGPPKGPFGTLSYLFNPEGCRFLSSPAGRLHPSAFPIVRPL